MSNATPASRGAKLDAGKDDKEKDLEAGENKAKVPRLPNGSNGSPDGGGTKGLSSWRVIWTLKPYFWPRQQSGKISVFFTWFFVVTSKASSVIAPFYIAAATNQLVRGEIRQSMLSCISYAALLLASKLLKELQSLVYLGVKQAAFVDLSEDTFEHVHTLSLQWYLSKKLGEVVRVVDRGIAACDTLMTYGVLYLGPAIGECLSVVVVFILYFGVWDIAALVLGGLVLYAWATIQLTIWRKQFRSAMNTSDNKWHDKLTDSLVNFETVKYFTNERYERERFGADIAQYQRSNVSVMASLSLLNGTQQVILQGTLAASLVLSAKAYKEGKMDVGDFVAVGVWIVQLFTPLNFLGTVYNAIITAWLDLHNLSQLLAQTPDVKDAPGARDLVETLALEQGPTKSPSQAGKDGNPLGAYKLAPNDDSRGVGVAFEDVKFHYPTGSGRGLKGVTFEVAPGTTTAIVGTTGAGKTTIGRLLFRFMDPVSGCIKVGGYPATGVTQASLRGLIGVVPQDTVLFNDTIAHNIKYGRLDAEMADLEEAARGAQILDFIKNLPEGWDTVVGERGLKLSGGEKQRVAIARCLLKNPPVVLLDEATSALDSVTERGVQDALNKLGENRTVMVIAHRLGTVQNADQIVVLSDGAVVEKGSHTQLIDKGGIYAGMWEMQAKGSSSELDTKAEDGSPGALEAAFD
mmetsp:Transcript_41361/g.93175  ORF Transcript_41361/g.93175 Transcript_41361/m.93175 type:complete len:689 (-) Transcript_41361:41-2107(-)|eukprot:CAMPEP_0172648982 /NCGR_PEP_ID=MMETSP1068-20121228/241554_1 /TAXON_ID=35684 /ORGANISM="Pseudopedinella elastica, Strain CCMP716" /LENGTH=688 /DNA_ID=CAMNT_0013463325 /DNA_START=65 /DNA_END=2131 /DNA_ORIENTATION=-